MTGKMELQRTRRGKERTNRELTQRKVREAFFTEVLKEKYNG